MYMCLHTEEEEELPNAVPRWFAQTAFGSKEVGESDVARESESKPMLHVWNIILDAGLIGCHFQGLSWFASLEACARCIIERLLNVLGCVSCVCCWVEVVMIFFGANSGWMLFELGLAEANTTPPTPRSALSQSAQWAPWRPVSQCS